MSRNKVAMGFAVSWYVEKQVIYLNLFGVVTSEEVIELNQQIVEHVHAGIQPVHIIIDTLNVTGFPNNLRWVMNIMQTNIVSPSGWNIVVHNSPVIHLLSSTILRILRVPVYTCANLEDAQTFLQAHVHLPFAFVS